MATIDRPDWSLPLIHALTSIRRAEHQLNLGHTEAGRKSLADAVEALAAAYDALPDPTAVSAGDDG
jgi:hypothetical protein